MTPTPTPVQVFADAEELGYVLATWIADQIVAAAEERRPYVLGCPGGRTARSTYAALADVVRERGLGLDHLVIAMMDEYAERTGEGFIQVSGGAHYSCRRFAEHEIVGPLNAAAATPVRDENIWLPNPADPQAYDEKLATVGGVDVFLLASGESDGHVAFNPPQSPRHSRTRVVELAESTRQDNMDTFPDFTTIKEVPTLGVTVGIDTISKLSDHLVMILVGEHKHTAFSHITATSDYDPAWPSTVIHLGNTATIVADQAAAGD